MKQTGKLKFTVISCSIIIISAMLCSCSNLFVSRITISIFPNTDSAYDLLIKTHPLPENFEYLNSETPSSRDTILLKKISGSTDAFIKGYKSKIVNIEITVPVKKIWESDVDNDNTLLLDEIELPFSGAPYNNLFPDHKDYALNNVLILSISEKAPDEIQNWFSTIPEKSTDPIVWVAAVGDIMVERGVEGILLTQADGLSTIFNDTLPILQNADILMGNLEGAVTAHSAQIKKSYNFKFKPDVLTPLKNAGFDYFMITNNHSYDYGLKGFTDTLANLKKFQAPFSGAGIDLDQANEYWETTVKGQTFRIISFGAYPRELSLSQLAAGPEKPGILFGEQGVTAVKNMASPESIDIVLAHAGTEYASSPGKSIETLYRRCIDAGADMVIGSHPHVLQGLEVYKNKLIAYSLGNFIFPGMEGWYNATDTMILLLGIYKGRIAYVQPIPAELSGKGVRLSAKKAILDNLYKLSKLQNQ